MIFCKTERFFLFDHTTAIAKKQYSGCWVN
jgi:hypothetical protein